MKRSFLTSSIITVLVGTAVAGCGRPESEAEPANTSARMPALATVRDSMVESVIEAAGTAEPYRRAMLSTRLMGTVLDVTAHEGDMVAAGALLVRIDARDLEARAAQVAAQQAEADAVRRDARTQADRIRRLYADSVATRAQLDAAETGLARAEAAVRQAAAAGDELRATAGYAEVRAPFAGTITERSVDPGAFAAPGAPLVTIEDAARLRITATAAPATVRGLRRGQRISARIEDATVAAIVEGVVPAPGGTTQVVNAIVDNPGGRMLPHSAATLLLPQGRASTRLVPAAAVTRDGDLTSVRVARNGALAVRWVRVGRTVGGDVEVLSGLEPGDQVAVSGGAQ